MLITFIALAPVVTPAETIFPISLDVVALTMASETIIFSTVFKMSAETFAAADSTFVIDLVMVEPANTPEPMLLLVFFTIATLASALDVTIFQIVLTMDPEELAVADIFFPVRLTIIEDTRTLQLTDLDWLHP